MIIQQRTINNTSQKGQTGPKKPRPIIWIFYIRLLSNQSLKFKKK